MHMRDCVAIYFLMQGASTDLEGVWIVYLGQIEHLWLGDMTKEKYVPFCSQCSKTVI
jgi:hypothetical protein